MNTEQSDNKVIQLDPPLCECELQRLMDLYYKDCERIRQEFSQPARRAGDTSQRVLEEWLAFWGILWGAMFLGNEQGANESR
jgi:hypothetical protein